MRLYKLLLVPVIVIALLAGCGGGGGSGGGTIPIPPINDGENQAPIISSISPQGTSASPIKLKLGASQHIVVAASDPDNDPLVITWSVDNGQIVGNGTDADFTAPQTACNAIVTVTVRDDHNHTVTAKCYFSVFKDQEPPPVDQNDPPVIASVVADPAEVGLEETSSIVATATDSDGDTLVYSWTCNGGSIQSQNNNSVIWKAPNVAKTCTVTVSVSDGKNPAVIKSVDIKVNGSTEPGVKNGLFATYIQNSHDIARPDLSKGKVVFTRIDPTINFDWGRKAPDERLITIPETGNGHDFGVIWKGYIKCVTPGAYNFRIKCDDGTRLWISDDKGNMQPVIDSWNVLPGIFEGQVTLEGGKWYKIEMHYFEDEDRSYVQLYWMPPQATEWAIVPTDALRTD